MLSALGASSAGGSDGARVEEIRIHSSLMPRPVPVRVWLPPGFEAAQPGTLPLLVFLHDGFGSERSFFRKGLAETLERMIDQGELPAFVVASPRTLGTYNSNDYLRKRRTFDFLTEALAPELLARYPQLRRDPDGRGLTGISLGGYGALKIAARCPGLFGSVSAVSTWVEDLSFEFQSSQGPFGRWSMGRVFGKTREASTIAEESLFRALAETDRSASARPPILLISGDEDPWIVNGNHDRLERALLDAAFRLEVVLRPGAHDWSFWRLTFPEIVRYHARRFAPSRSAARSES